MTLDEILSFAEVDALDAPEAVAWQIDGRNTLEWAMGRLAAAERETMDIRRAAAAARDTVAAREAELVRKVERTALFLRSAVESYARSHRAALLTSRSKTVGLIHGEIQFRSHAETVEVIDPAAALEWARSQPVEADMVRTRYEINKKALNAYVAAGVEIPPGVEVRPAVEDIVIKPDAPDTLDVAPSRKEIAP